MVAAPTGSNVRRDFYERIASLSMAPLWESLHQLVPPQPAPKYEAAHWDYDRVRPFLMESGSLITAREAIRRVLPANSAPSSTWTDTSTRRTACSLPTGSSLRRSVA